MSQKASEPHERRRRDAAASFDRGSLSIAGFAALVLLLTLFLPVRSVHAVIYDRVVAFVDNQAITLSEFEEQFLATQRVSPSVSAEDVINTMINRKLLLREARKYRLEGDSDDAIVKEYIDIKVRAVITVGESEIEEFYKSNRERFADTDYESARGDIERYLTERRVNERLKEVIGNLRKKAFIRIQIK